MDLLVRKKRGKEVSNYQVDFGLVHTNSHYTKSFNIYVDSFESMNLCKMPDSIPLLSPTRNLCNKLQHLSPSSGD